MSIYILRHCPIYRHIKSSWQVFDVFTRGHVRWAPGIIWINAWFLVPFRLAQGTYRMTLTCSVVWNISDMGLRCESIPFTHSFQALIEKESWLRCIRKISTGCCSHFCKSNKNCMNANVYVTCWQNDCKFQVQNSALNDKLWKCAGSTYRLKSLLQQAYITGFILELIHPSHVTTADTISSCSMHCMQKPESKLTTKNGSQHTMNTPITIPNVLAAFFSFANFANFRDKEKFLPICRCRPPRPLLCNADNGSSSGSSGVEVAVAECEWWCWWCPSRVVPPRCIRSVSWSSPDAISTCFVPNLSDLVCMTAAR